MDKPDRDKVRAEEVKGLRELIAQVVREERVMFYPRPLVEDMDELRVLLVVMIILNGDKVIQFLNVLIP